LRSNKHFVAEFFIQTDYLIISQLYIKIFDISNTSFSDIQSVYKVCPYIL